jgi:hypothetical protein
MKILDRREIEFNAMSVAKAIAVSPKAAQGFGLPGLPPVGVRFYPKDAKVDVLYGTKDAPRAVSISAGTLGALLVSYCIRARIPMPRKSDKGIRIESHSVILAFRTKYDEAPHPELAETSGRASESVTAWTWLKPDRAMAD